MRIKPDVKLFERLDKFSGNSAYQKYELFLKRTESKGNVKIMSKDIS